MLSGNIVLPEYQRHFVWRERDVKRLLQSLSDGQFVQPVTIALYDDSAKLLQKSEMRKNMVMDLIYRGFIYAANYSESHYNPRRSQIKTELRYLFVTTPNR